MSRGVKCKVLLKNVVDYSNRVVGAKRFIEFMWDYIIKKTTFIQYIMKGVEMR